MTVDALLIELAQHGVRLKLLSNGQLSLKVLKGGLPETLRERVTEHKEALVESLRRKQSAILPEELPALVPDSAARYESFPLSDVQHAYWIGRNAYVDLGGVSTNAYVEIETALDIARLEIALQKLIARHDMLRAVIDSDGRQRVLPQIPPYRLQTIDARGQSAAEQETAILAVRDRMSHQVLPTDHCPLFAVSATLLEESKAILHIGVDMLIADGASLFIFFNEWSRFYREPDWQPEPVPVTFRDYIMAEQALRERPSYRQAREYWMKRLDDIPAAPQLPHVASPAEVSRFVRRMQSLPRDDWQRLKERAKAVGITSSVLVLTAFAETLRRWCKETDFTVNLTLFNRLSLHPAVSQVLGDFTSVSMMTTRARSGESFLARAQRMQRQLYVDLEHRQFSGVRVLQERARRVGMGPSAAMPVVFTSVLGLGAAEQGADAVDFFGNTRYSISQTPQVHLDCQAFERGGGLTISWDAVEALYPAQMLDDMFESYQGLLRRLAHDEQAWHTQRPLAALPAWQETERRTANATQTDIPPRTLHGLVEEQAIRTPDAVAVMADDGARTYRELITCASRLGHRLHALGAKPNTLIAVVMDKGWEQIVAVLGVLQSGAAYLPIDPSLPANRRAVLLQQGQAKLVVTQSHHQTTLEWPADVTVLTLHEAATQTCSAEPLALPAAVDDLAYVIFTSGSTGIPKGVMIDHRGAANTVQDINRRFNVDKNDRVLALSSLSFDLSVYDIFGLLSAGGTIVMPAAERATDPSHWTELVERHHITLWNSVPQLLQLWIDYLERISCPRQGPRLALLSGDWIPPKLPDQARARYPEMQIVSLGGATEASIWSVYYPITEVNPEWKSIPYGKPLANQTLHIYNDLFEPCAVFTPGHLYIGGIGLAKGYWGDAQKTAERFITPTHTGERLYKTGDLGRYLPGGDIEFLGREDFQVKVNGYRVELGEIAMQLRNVPGVSDALVSVAARHEQHGKQLVAYVIPETSVANNASVIANVGADHDDDDHARKQWARAGAGALRAYRDAHRETLEAAAQFFRQCDALAPFVMASTLARLGFFVTAGEHHTARRIGDQYGLAALKISLVDKWLRALATAGMLTQMDRRGEYRCASPFDIDKLNKEVHERLARLRAPGALQPLVSFTRWCVEHQQQLLLGQIDVRERMFASGDGEVADSVYRRNPLSAMHNQVAAMLVQTVVGGIPPEKRLRILEIGAGTGATTVSILPVLPSERTSYVFTDISLFFIEHAKRHLAAPAFVEYRLFDIDRGPVLQGLELGSFDIIIAMGTLHNAKDIGKTLARVRSLLAPGGVLVMSEATRNADSLLLSFGHLEVFGHQEDWRKEANRTLPSRQEWEKCLRDAGFTHIACFGDDPDSDQSGDPQTLLAQAPAEVAHLDLSRLREALTQTLPDYMVPHHFVLLNEFPLSANGKVDIKALPIPWSGRSSSASVRAMPTNPTEQQLLDVWCELLERKEIGVDDNFFELGGDSLIAVGMVARLQQQFALREDTLSELLGYVFQHPTITQLSKFLLKAGTGAVRAPVLQPERTGSPLVQLRAAGENMPCFFVHGADGNVLRYRELAERLGRPFYALQAPGLSSARAPFETIEQMAIFYRQAIQHVCPNGPYLLGGWSAGGLTAFEIARQLEMQGQRIERVVMIDAPSPAPGVAVDNARLLCWFLEDLNIGIDVEKIDAAEIFAASHGSLTSALALIRQRQGIRTGVDTTQLERVFEVFQHTVHAASGYRPQTLLRADISVLRASEGRVREFGQHWANTAEDWGWSRHTTGRIHSAAVPGTHYSLLRGENLDVLIDRLTSQLASEHPNAAVARQA